MYTSVRGVVPYRYNIISCKLTFPKNNERLKIQIPEYEEEKEEMVQTGKLLSFPKFNVIIIHEQEVEWTFTNIMKRRMCRMPVISLIG